MAIARYSELLGRRVAIRYLEGEILLPAAGVLAADSGKSIFLEEHTPRERLSAFRWEIPYAALVEIQECVETNEIAEMNRSALIEEFVAQNP